MKKVMCLYRVSTKGQVDQQTDDIPLQRRECLAFIQRMPGWVFYDERIEKGVSGYKVSASKRDAILDLRTLASQKAFDVLLVFMFDRLGRREDETPFLVEWFVEHGIEVWSTREGQQKFENRSDKLINFIRFWQAGGESEKISLRVKAAHTQMTEDGRWRGGIAPYGYKKVLNGRIGKKNRQLYDLVIDEVQGPIVQEIFSLLAEQGYGAWRIATYLNEKYPNPSKTWSAHAILRMVRNPVYTGRFHFNDTLSQPVESLRLVSDDTAQFALYAIASRLPKRRSVQQPSAEATGSKSASLLTGILYCGHCGRKMTGTLRVSHRHDTTTYCAIYRCHQKAFHGVGCDGQTTYVARRIEEAVLEIVRHYFQTMQQVTESVWQEQSRTQKRPQVEAQIKQATQALAKLQQQAERLRQEVMRSLMGESSFDADLLQEMLAQNQADIAAAQSTLDASLAKQEAEKSRLQYLSAQSQQLHQWASEFDQADRDTQKMILSHLIEKITIKRKYHLTVSFFITQTSLRSLFETDTATAEVVQSESPVPFLYSK